MFSPPSQDPNALPSGQYPLPGADQALPSSEGLEGGDLRHRGQNTPILVDEATITTRGQEQDPESSDASSKSSDEASNHQEELKLEEVDEKKKRKKPIHWTEAKKICLLQICAKYEKTYGKAKSGRRWWNIVCKAFYKAKGEELTHNVQRTVYAWVEQRRGEIEALGTGEEDKNGEYIIAIDKWREIVDRDEQAKGTAKKTEEQLEQEEKKAKRERKSWTKPLSQKRRRAATPDLHKDNTEDADGAIVLSEGDEGATATAEGATVTPAESFAASKKSKITATRRSQLAAERRADRQLDLLESVRDSITSLTNSTTTNSSNELSFEARLQKIEDELAASRAATADTNNRLDRIVSLLASNSSRKDSEG